ncbi:MAG: thioredoxin family protein [Desulfurococcales archaeon]|nr:thioredoxin family protein [Desulfurococcales archaeon]
MGGSSDQINDEISQLKELLMVKFSGEELKALAEALSDMRNEVTAYTFIDNDCLFCNEAVKLMNTISAVSPKHNDHKLFKHSIIHRSTRRDLFEKLKIERVPTTILLNGAIRYVGVPAGEEIRGLVETIIRISTSESGLSSSAVKKLEEVECDIKVRVIVTPLCPYCPYAVLLANMTALEAFKQGKENVVAEIVEAFENPDIADSYGITNVPAIIVNDVLAYVGVPYEEEFIEILRKVCHGQ